MVRLVQKSGYIKPGKAAGYMEYIATRKGVEKLHGKGAVSKKQQKLITDLLRDFPDSRQLFEYRDYQAAPTVGNASAFITMALDSNVHAMAESDVYMKYIATRPRVEKRGDHGLFSDALNVDLTKAMSELSEHTGNVWTIIYSLHREDAARLGYDRAASWQSLISAKRTELAKAMKIPPGQFAWYAAFHDEGHHPHIHLMVWSTDPKQGYLARDGIEDMRSVMTNTIFKDDLLHVYTQKDISYKELTAAARASMEKLVAAMENGVCDNPRLEELLAELARQMKTVSGKKQYGYLPKPVKRLVDGIVDELARHPDVAACYEQWNHVRDEIERYYKDMPRQHLPLSEQKEFRAVKNMVVREAMLLAGMEQTENKEAKQQTGTSASASGAGKEADPVAAADHISVPPGRDPALFVAVTRMLRHLGRIFRDNAMPPANPAGPRIESKRRRQLMERRQATGQRMDDTMQSMS